MKIYDLTPLKNNDEEYRKLKELVSERYKDDWDDKVHDSYLIYVKQVQEQLQKLHVIRCKADILEKEAENLNVEELQKRAENLCREADSI